MIIQKWNNDIKEYEPYSVPDEWHLPLWCENMDEVINCVCCGKQMKYGNGYTSRRFHTEHGMGYYECEQCYFSYKE